MNITGNCENEFKEWYKNLNLKIPYVVNEDGEKDYWDLEYEYVFKNLPDAMKYGVYVDYFDSVGLNILLTVEFDYGYIITENRYEEIEYVKKYYDTRPQARTAAIEKADEIRNEQIKKENEETEKHIRGIEVNLD